MATRSIPFQVPACEMGLCAEGDPREAKFLLPQVALSTDPPSYRWLLVCPSHAEGWWEEEDTSRVLHAYRLKKTPYQNL